MKSINTALRAVGVIAVLMLATQSLAGLTTVQTPWNGSGVPEYNLVPKPGNPSPNLNIMDTLYGVGGWTQFQDTGGIGNVDLHNPNVNQLAEYFSDGLAYVKATVRYAGHAGVFGWHDSTPTSETIMTVSGSGFAPNFTVTYGANWTGGYGNLSSLFHFWYTDSVTTSTWDSVASMNSDSLDHMVAFLIPATGHIVLAWEDLTNPNSDWDYNDLVVELTVIPAPAAAMLGVVGVGLVVWIKRRL